MKKPVCAVFDRKIQLFDSPFVVRHTGEALREFETVMTDKNTKFGKNPEDFELWQLGWFDESSGNMQTLEEKVQLGAHNGQTPQ